MADPTDASAGRRSWRRVPVHAAGVLLIALIVVSRVLARQRSFWEWDDYIFGLALHLFAPQSYVPQPPFFPAFIFLARFANRFFHNDVAALTWVSVASSGIAAGFVFAITRELIDDVRLAWSAALLFAFFPASWFAAGIPIADTAGISAALAAVWLSIRARRNSRLLLLAAAALGLAIGVRTQTAFIAFVPFAMALKRNPRRAVFVLSLLALSTGVFWALPVFQAAGGVRPIFEPVLRQWNNVVGGTSPLARSTSAAFLARRWLLDTWSSPFYAVAAWVAIAVGAVALWRRRSFDFFVLLGAGTCLYAVCAVMFLDVAATGRYVIPILPAAAIAAAIGLDAIEGRGRFPRGILTAVFVAASVVVVGPAIRVLHTRLSPPVDAASRVKAEAGPGRYAVVYPAQMYVPAELLFPGVPKFELEKTPVPVLAGSPIPVWRFGVPAPDDDRSASWPALRPFSTIGMGRYLRVPYGEWRAESAVFGEGWYPEEQDGEQRFRWMGRRAVILFPPSRKPLAVRFALVAPLRFFARPPELTVEWNGTVLERRVIRSDRTDISCRLPWTTEEQAKGVLTLSSTETFNPRRAGSSGDDRDLAFELRQFSWSATVTSSPSPSSRPRAS